MACGDDVKAGVGIDPVKRAHHTFIRSGLTDDQINHIYGFVYIPAAIGQATSLDTRKIQEAALRFYDKPLDVDRHRDSRASQGQYSRPLMGPTATTTHRHQTSHQQGRVRARALGRRDLSSRRWLRVQRVGQLQYPAEEPDDWVEEADLGTCFAGDSDWVHRDLVRF